MQQIYVQGLAELQKELEKVKILFNGPELGKVAMDAAAVMGKEVRRRAPVGPTGNLRKAVNWFRGKKASKFGAVAVLRVRTPKRGSGFTQGTAPHAYLAEYGTAGPRYPKGKAMRIPLSKFGAKAGRVVNIWTGRAGGRGANVGGLFGYRFVRQIGRMPAAGFFVKGVQATSDKAVAKMRDGANDILFKVGK
jgi:hypothetical protein